MPQWEADLEVGEDLVQRLLAEQFPELDADSARLLGEGFDNSVWVVEERLAFRFPRRAIAVPLVERELSVLPRLASLLPLPVPTPTHVGQPGEGYPWPFFGCPLLPGREPSEMDLSDEDRVAMGRDLGRFLRVLHDPATRAAVEPETGLPVDPNRRANMAVRVERTRAALEQLQHAGLWHAPHAVAPLLREAESLSLPRSEEAVLAHGDLHVRHVLVRRGRLSGVIDWGDVCVADPSIDLVLPWSVLPPAGRAHFVDEYGPVDDERLLRGRVLAIFLSALLAAYAHDVGHASLERESLAGLDRALVDWG